MSHFWRVILCFAGAALLMLPTAVEVSGQDGDRFNHVRAAIEELVATEGVPSLTVAVVKDGQILWEEGFGWANRERRVPANEHTPYSLASLTKTVTSTAIMLLSEREQIDLDAPVERYLGRLRLQGLAADPVGVTARRIMAHSAGLPTHYYFYHAGYPPPSAEETITRYGIVVYPPNRTFQYSNVGYRTLDIAIANISGTSYGDFLRREIFLPLGMTRSALDVHPAWAAEAATRYDRRQRPIAPYSTDHPGSGDVWSSAHDMLRFAMLHLSTPLADQRSIIGAASIRAMQQPSSAPGSPIRWGLGWSLEEERGYRVLRHGGQQPGVDNQLVLFPDERVAIVVLSNRNDPKVRGIWKEIARVVLPEDRRESEPLNHGPVTPGSELELAGAWAGTVTTYEGTEPFTLTFQEDGDIEIQVGGRMRSLLNFVEHFDGGLAGWSYGVMNTDDALRHRHVLFLSLILVGGELIGQLVAETTSLDPGIFALSSFVRLQRQ